MGLYTYDITLERIATPQNRRTSTQDDPSADPTAIAVPEMDVETYSVSSYEHEFEEHPDLVKCAATRDQLCFLRTMQWH